MNNLIPYNLIKKIPGLGDTQHVCNNNIKIYVKLKDNIHSVNYYITEYNYKNNIAYGLIKQANGTCFKSFIHLKQLEHATTIYNGINTCIPLINIVKNWDTNITLDKVIKLNS